MSNLSKATLLLAFALFLGADAMAQTGTIEGVVIDQATSEPLPGASVRVDGTNIGAATGATGAYSFTVDPGTYEVVASFIGYADERRTIEVDPGETVVANFGLESDIAGLEDVVVTGLTSRRSRERSEVAVSSVNVAELTLDNTYQDISQILTGKTAGVNIQPASGNVGGGIRFNIRSVNSLTGSGQPIIFIDGVRIDNNSFNGFGAGGQDFGPLADINPEDIADMEILKGPAAAAIYGTDGVNGVVLITTKRGQIGQDGRLDVRYKGTFGTSSQQTEYDDFFISADRANDIFVDGDIQQHTLEVSGGSRTVSYLVSGTQRDEDGILRNNNGTRTNLLANFEAFPSKQVTVRSSASYTISETQRPDNDNNIFGQLGNVLLAPGGSPFFFTDSIDVFSIEDVIETQRFLGSVGLTWRPLEDFAINATAGYDGVSRRQDKSYPSTGSFVGVDQGERNILNRASDFFNANVSALYSYDINDRISGSTTVGSQFVSERIRQNNATAQVFSTNLITDIGAGADNLVVGEFLFNERTAGVYVQQDLSLDNTLFVTGQLRRDFATIFGEELSAANVTYPAISAALRVDQFDFVPSAFSILKPRVAYGVSAVPNGFLSAIPLTFTAGGSAYGAGAILNSAGDPSIKPERVSEFEFGADLELFERYSLEFTRFSTSSEDAIIFFAPAPSSGRGFLDVPRNVGGLVSSGYEFALGLTPINRRNLSVDLNLTYTTTDNEVEDMGGAPPSFSGFDINVIAEGLPRSAFYTQLPTGARFNEDGTAVVSGGNVLPTFAENPEDIEFCQDDDAVEAAGQRGSLRCDGRSFIGTPYAQSYGGISLGVNLFENLRVSALADYSRDLHVYNNTAQFAVSFSNSTVARDLREQLGITDDDPDNRIEPLEVGSEAYIDAANRLARLNPNFDGNFVQEADFFKLREIAVSYDFSDLIRRAGSFGQDINRLVLGISARNIYQWTSYDGVDPEVNFGGSIDDDLGQDFLTLQQPRQFNFTIQVGF